jgi:hypothetical protein
MLMLVAHDLHTHMVIHHHTSRLIDGTRYSTYTSTSMVGLPRQFRFYFRVR